MVVYYQVGRVYKKNIYLLHTQTQVHSKVSIDGGHLIYVQIFRVVKKRNIYSNLNALHCFGCESEAAMSSAFNKQTLSYLLPNGWITAADKSSPLQTPTDHDHRLTISLISQ